jgi:hypothetical protein
MTALWKSRIGTGAVWLFTLGGTALFACSSDLVGTADGTADSGAEGGANGPTEPPDVPVVPPVFTDGGADAQQSAPVATTSPQPGDDDDDEDDPLDGGSSTDGGDGARDAGRADGGSGGDGGFGGDGGAGACSFLPTLPVRGAENACFAAGPCGSPDPVCCDAQDSAGDWAPYCSSSAATCMPPALGAVVAIFACSQDANCGAGTRCYVTEYSDWTGGVELGSCGYLLGSTGTVCTNKPAPTDIATCVSDADCAAGAICTAVSAKGQAVGVCIF